MKSTNPAKKILVLGATSAIARATAHHFAHAGDELFLAGRDMSEIERIAADIHIRYQTKVAIGHFVAEDTEKHEHFFRDVTHQLGGLDGVLLATGYMGEDPQLVLMANFNGPVSILNLCADYLAAQNRGFIIGISSVAGDRGRQSNYIYGSAKAGLSIYLQGLRNRLFKKHVRVITVKPGFVDTAMTFGLPGMFLVASPDDIGKKIAQSIKQKQDILYLPWFWRYIMLIINYIPEKIFKRLSL